MQRMLLFLCLIILPFNALSILLSFFTLRNLRYNYEQQVTNTFASYAEMLGQRLDTVDYQLFDLSTNDTSFLQFRQNNGDWHHELNRYNLTTTMDNEMTLSSAADAMFIKLSFEDDLTVVKRFQLDNGNLMTHVDNNTLKDLMQDGSVANGRWHLIEEDGSQYLIRIIRWSDCTFGAYINCTTALESLLERYSENGTEVLLSQTGPEEMPGMLLCSAYDDTADLYI